MQRDQESKTGRMPRLRAVTLALATGAALLVGATQASAQSREELRRQNEALKAELAAVRHTDLPVSTAAGVMPTQKIADLALRVDSLRVGPATGYASGHIAVTVALELENTGASPLALNYNKGSFALIDDRGYQYKLYHENSGIYYNEDLKGISMASSARAGTDDIIDAGQRLTVTFIAVRYMQPGQTPGNRFSLNATFGSYVDLGQGRVRLVRNYSAAFADLQPSQSGASPLTGKNRGKSLRDALNGLLKH